MVMMTTMKKKKRVLPWLDRHFDGVPNDLRCRKNADAANQHTNRIQDHSWTLCVISNFLKCLHIGNKPPVVITLDTTFRYQGLSPSCQLFLARKHFVSVRLEHLAYLFDKRRAEMVSCYLSDRLPDIIIFCFSLYLWLKFDKFYEKIDCKGWDRLIPYANLFSCLWFSAQWSNIIWVNEST